MIYSVVRKQTFITYENTAILEIRIVNIEALIIEIQTLLSLTVTRFIQLFFVSTMPKLYMNNAHHDSKQWLKEILSIQDDA